MDNDDIDTTHLPSALIPKYWEASAHDGLQIEGLALLTTVGECLRASDASPRNGLAIALPCKTGRHRPEVADCMPVMVGFLSGMEVIREWRWPSARRWARSSRQGPKKGHAGWRSIPGFASWSWSITRSPARLRRPS